MAANQTEWPAVEFAFPASLPKNDVQRCEDEPIRIPGSIQRHGFLLLLNPSGTRIVGASENAEEFLEVPLSLLLGAPVDSVLEREVLGALRAVTDGGGVQRYLGSLPLRGRLYSVITHYVGEERIVEFELLARLVSPDLSNLVFTNFVTQLSQLKTELELCQALTRHVRDLTHFNRVLLYRFDEAGHGEVLCEENDGSLPLCLGLRFPASDIPSQARELYMLNTMRIIPDAGYTPSPLVGLHDRPLGALDLSMSVLRSVSPVHLQYMQNMGTASSMSISIVSEGKLWGLVSGHHAEVHTAPYLVRSACDLLTKLVSVQLLSFRNAANLVRMSEFHAVQHRMLTHMAAGNNYLASMADRMEDLLHITSAAGVALIVDGEAHVFGVTPDAKDRAQIVAWMNSQPDREIFETHQLATYLPASPALKAVASGLLSIRISHIRQSYVLWFRPEVIRTVHWAGEPVKSHTQSETSGQALAPRSSFESWKEIVSGVSEPWTTMELESASEFRRSVMTISLKRAEEAVLLGEARFLQLTHALPHPVWTVEDDGWTTYVNQRWLDQGFRKRGLWFEQDRISREDRDHCARQWADAVDTGSPLSIEVCFLATRDFPARWNLIQAIAYLRSDGTRAGWVGTCTDLTDRRQHEAAVQMTEKLALTGRMTSVIAHEINNPLEAITNLLYLLGGNVQHDSEARGYIELAEMELQRISAITRQTLRWAKETGHRPKMVLIGSLLNEVLRIYAGKIRNREVHVVVQGQDDVQAYGVSGQLSQVLANLLANAIDAVAVGGRIWLGFDRVGDQVEIGIRDNGQGMSDETLRNLFQPFFSTKGDLGNGLGLYLSHEIVMRHGGSFDVSSKIGEGTDIRLRLPTKVPAG